MVDAMEKYQGKGIGKNVAIGKLQYLSQEQTVHRKHIDHVEAEKNRVKDAQKIAVFQLKELYQKAVEEVGEENAEIFEVHQYMLEDEDYCDFIDDMIQTEQVNAEFAVAKAGEHFAQQFAQMEDEYFRARSVDVQDISERLIRILSGSLGVNQQNEPVIIVAHNLTPSETVQMDKKLLLGFVTCEGSAQSHTAILARTMDIPALVGIEGQVEWDGKWAIVDAKEGILFIDPDEALLQSYREKIAKQKMERAMLETLKGQEAVTQDGKNIKLYANIANVNDVEMVLQNGAQGIGLFRSEFLYLESLNYPTEEAQFLTYQQVAQKMGGKKVIIRTLDIGADKQVDYFKLPKEENPAMGFRAIRICLERPEIFQTQLRAIYRASAFGNLAIMYPMIISVEEVRKIKEISRQVREQLQKENIPFRTIEEGIMIETPAAVMMSDELAKEVDFFSVGTNDLTQYTLAIDRQNAKLENIYDAHHPAILRMIKMVVDHAHEQGIWAGICGELGADETLTQTLLQLGVDELSVTPAALLRICDQIRKTTVKVDC
jgi:phosphotransferase system enzyme I (PtsI)